MTPPRAGFFVKINKMNLEEILKQLKLDTNQAETFSKLKEIESKYLGGSGAFNTEFAKLAKDDKQKYGR